MTAFTSGRAAAVAAKPRIGFLGLGWIGFNRMQGLTQSGLIEAAAIADPSAEMMVQASRAAPEAEVPTTLDELLDMDLDGIVIATPSALHAEQAIRALKKGIAVFCQKPLGRTAAEVRAVIDAAKAADRLLGLDMCYRSTRAMEEVSALVRSGELGHVYAVDLVFHNAYGPDKPWFYDRAQSGGGCVMDLGIHLVDTALWTLGFPEVSSVTSKLFSGGKLLEHTPQQVEDYALATLELESGTAVQLNCSWRLPAGRDAVISASFYGTEGGAAFRNVDGSFYDFTAERYRGTSAELLTLPPDDWGARAVIDWARRLTDSRHYDPEAEQFEAVAVVIDRIYGR